MPPPAGGRLGPVRAVVGQLCQGADSRSHDALPYVRRQTDLLQHGGEGRISLEQGAAEISKWATQELQDAREAASGEGDAEAALVAIKRAISEAAEVKASRRWRDN